MELLDCTIRDGGYLNNWNYTNDEVLDCYKSVTRAGIDYFEIGFKTNENLLPGKGKWCYSREEDIRINFDAWIWPYVDLYEEQKNNQNIDCSPCSVED